MNSSVAQTQSRFIVQVTRIGVAILDWCTASGASADQPSHRVAVVENRQAAVTAKPSWSRALTAAGDSPISLVSDGAQVIVSANSGLVSYSPDGRVRWMAAGGFGPPLAVANRRVYAIDREAQSLVAFDLARGRLVWRSRRIANLDVDPERGRILVNAQGLALFTPWLVFVDLKTGHVRAAEQEGMGLMFSDETVRAAQLVDNALFVAISYDGATIDTVVAQYDVVTGRRVWQSPNDASRFWIRDHTAMIADDPAGPWFSYAPIALETRTTDGYSSPLPWNQATFAPDPPAKLQPAYSSSLTPAYVAWPYLVIVANARIYRYDLRHAPGTQSPDRLDTDDPILGTLSDGTFVIASKSNLELVSFGSKVPHLRRVSRVALSDTQPFPTFIPLGNSAAQKDASGTALIDDGGKRVVDITSSCHTLLAAASLSPGVIDAVCKNESQTVLEQFGRQR